MRTVDIPGGTAKFKTRELLRGRDTKLIKTYVFAAQGLIAKLGDDAEVKPGETKEQAAKRLTEMLQEKKVTFTPEEAEAYMSLQEAVAVAYLDSWTLDIPKPTMESIGDLPGTIYDALLEAASGELGEVAKSNDFSPNPDQSSPTGPSSASNGSLRAEPSQEPSSTPSWSSGDVPSSGDVSSKQPSLTTTTPTT